MKHIGLSLALCAAVAAFAAPALANHHEAAKMDMTKMEPMSKMDMTGKSGMITNAMGSMMMAQDGSMVMMDKMGAMMMVDKAGMWMMMDKMGKGSMMSGGKLMPMKAHDAKMMMAMKAMMMKGASGK